MQVVCPLDGTVHHADDAHIGKMLRCAKCGNAVQIGAPAPTRDSVSGAARSGMALAARLPRWLSFDQARAYFASLRGRPLGAGRVVVLGAVLAALIVVVVLEHRRADPAPSAATSSAGSQSALNTQSFAPVNATASGGEDIPGRSYVRPWREPEQFRTLPTGTRLRPDIGSGRGVLTLDDEDGSDAEVKIVSLSSGRAVRDVFIQRGAKLKLRGLEEGSYEVIFATGSDWDAAAKRFTRDRAFFEFGKTLDFKETTLADAVEYSSQEITLYTLPDGTVARQSIPESGFQNK